MTLGDDARADSSVQSQETAGASDDAINSGPWRCLNPSCSPDCVSCSCPPATVDEKMYVLAGDPGRKNGEKKLRHLILNCPEWLSRESREELAAHLTRKGGGDPSLVAALRAKDPTALRKRHLVLLCREWRYKCSLWVHKKTIDSARADPESHSRLMERIDARDILNHEAFGRTITLDAVLEYFQTSVGPLLALAEYNFSAPGARRLCQATRQGGRVVTPDFLKKQLAMQSVYAAINARVANNHSHCRNVVSAFGPREFQRPDGSPVLASEALYGRECPVEETLQALGASGSALLRHVKDTEAKLTSEKPLSAVEAAWVQDLTDFSLALLEFVARVQSLLSQLMFAPFEFFVRVMVDQVMAACERAAAVYQVKLLERISWMEAHLSADSSASEEPSGTSGGGSPSEAPSGSAGADPRDGVPRGGGGGGVSADEYADDASILAWDHLRVTDCPVFLVGGAMVPADA